MNAVGYTLVFGTVGAFISLLTLWLFAENCWSKRVRITLGLLAILTAVPVTALIAAGVTQIDDQSYFAASVRTLLDETVASLEAGEPGFLDRLKTFRENQILTYETRGNLLENARAFREEGEAQRTKTEKTEPAAGHAPSVAASGGDN